VIWGRLVQGQTKGSLEIENKMGEKKAGHERKKNVAPSPGWEKILNVGRPKAPRNRKRRTELGMVVLSKERGGQPLGVWEKKKRRGRVTLGGGGCKGFYNPN